MPRGAGSVAQSAAYRSGASSPHSPRSRGLAQGLLTEVGGSAEQGQPIPGGQPDMAAGGAEGAAGAQPPGPGHRDWELVRLLAQHFLHWFFLLTGAALGCATSPTSTASRWLCKLTGNDAMPPQDLGQLALCTHDDGALLELGEGGFGKVRGVRSRVCIGTVPAHSRQEPTQGRCSAIPACLC